MTNDKTDWLAVGVVLGEIGIFWVIFAGVGVQWANFSANKNHDRVSGEISQSLHAGQKIANNFYLLNAIKMIT
jgi:hypothetical protein